MLPSRVRERGPLDELTGVGCRLRRHPDARLVVVSNDKGYAPLLEHAAELGFSARQVGFGKSSSFQSA